MNRSASGDVFDASQVGRTKLEPRTVDASNPAFGRVNTRSHTRVKADCSLHTEPSARRVWFVMTNRPFHSFPRGHAFGARCPFFVASGIVSAFVRRLIVKI